MKNTIGETADLEGHKEMKTRIISAAVLVPFLFLVALVLDEIVAALIVALMMAVGAYELLFRTRLVRNPRLVIYSCVMAAFMSIWSYLGANQAVLLLALLVYLVLLFSEMMMDHVKVRFEMLALCFFAGFLVPYLLTAVVRILMMGLGRYMIMIPFVVAFVSDGGAYFAGIFLGKHKLAPVVSPNKTIEGAVGGLLAAMLGMILYALILDLGFHFEVNYLVAILYGLLGSAVGVFGDLIFSVIKRQTGIKDYGNLIPGHGGVLDRFDSVMMVAPLMEALLLIAPVVM